MTTMETLKRRISTAEDLQSVVRTMKSLAAVNVRQFEESVESLASYSETVERATRMLLFCHPHMNLVSPNVPTGTEGAVVFGSDQGMCGGFNERVTRQTLDHLAERHGLHRLICVGHRPAEKLLDAGASIDTVFECPGAVGGITPLIQELLPRLNQWRSEHRLVRIHLVFTARTVETLTETRTKQLLPIDWAAIRKDRPTRWEGRSLPMVTLDPDRMLSALVQQYVFIELYRACAESMASENASRMAALHSAEQNISTRIDEYQGDFQQLRQSSITEELLDIVSGFEALSSSRKKSISPQH